MSNVVLKIKDKYEYECEEEEKNINLYISELTEQEKVVLKIAKEHLESSFSIEKSIGYLNWLKKEKEKK